LPKYSPQSQRQSAILFRERKNRTKGGNATRSKNTAKGSVLSGGGSISGTLVAASNPIIGWKIIGRRNQFEAASSRYRKK
jgi:hypothetical protein